MPDVSSRWFDLGARGASYLARLVFPDTCAGCGAAGCWMCELCERDLVDISSQPIVTAARAAGVDESLPGGMSAVELRARYAFAGPARKAVHLLKYGGERARAEWFAQVLAPIVAPHATGGAVLVPVPLTARRIRKRGYNQSAEIAAQLALLTGMAVVNCAERIRETRPQVELNGIERLHNVRGAFRADNAVRDRMVILIDDVVTTGATMRECGRACYDAGALSVIGVAGAAGQGRR